MHSSASVKLLTSILLALLSKMPLNASHVRFCFLYLIFDMAAAQPLHFEAIFLSTPAPFQINVSSSFTADTLHRVSMARFPEPLGLPLFTDGPPLHDASTIRDYWTKSYNWSTVQSCINGDLQQYTTTIDTVDASPYKHVVPLHFVHHKSPHHGAPSPSLHPRLARLFSRGG